ncbi:phage protein [Streptococcus pyogenes]|uniref:hypothetical protein n=1 Tax=Streptococcus pyogenes TaxID=1314 RepID=UPI0004F6281E|nr:hypothetical protein [Streptococcus pyogenes]QBX28512.1 hypothetical protein Javan456_0018 [Streptococcus phage Javan456]AIQ01198.1 hypothetical protein FE90_0429 [Streptococcus pyogenes]PWU76765.1 hypothetical protein DJ558_04150 [Streptococcus pyogenes]QCK25552.1 hypothetical protein ETT73_05860 [Streptococcus pyogenes]SQE56096.1 phage protein [Streptococcus pyogenes]
MKPSELIRNYFKEHTCKTEADCAKATGVGRNTVKQCVWRDRQRGLATKDRTTGFVTYEDGFAEIPEKINGHPLAKVSHEMLNRLLEQTEFITDDELLLRFSKEIRLYIAELKGLLR